jgi:hypothetical protein
MHLTPLLPAGVHASGRHQTCLYRYGFGQTARHLSLPAQTCSVCMHGCVCVYVWLIMCVCVRVRVRVRVCLVNFHCQHVPAHACDCFYARL